MSPDKDYMIGAPKILVIDDEPEICSLLRFLLTREGFDVHIALTVREARQAIQSHEYDGVVCDYVMPDTDGIHFLRELRTSGNQTPFVFLSSQSTETEENELPTLGMFQVIHKPQVRLLAPAIKSLIKKYQDLNHKTPVKPLMLHEARRPA